MRSSYAAWLPYRIGDAEAFHDPSNFATRCPGDPPLTHCVVSSDPSKLILWNPFAEPSRFRNPRDAQMLWAKRFGSTSPHPCKIAISRQDLQHPSSVTIGSKEGHPYSKEFDSLFEKYADGIVPVPYLRTLSYSESRLDPNNVTPSSNAVGLFQIVYVVLKDWNKANGTNYTAADLKDPDLNSKIGVTLIKRIVTSYAKNHPKTLKPNWTDRRYVELLTMGFNAGYSERGGVGKIVGMLEQEGVAPEAITADAVVAKAKASGLKSARYIALRGTAYPKAVTTRYFAELGMGNRGSFVPADRAVSSWKESSALVRAEPPKESSAAVWALGISLMGVAGWFLFIRR